MGTIYVLSGNLFFYCVESVIFPRFLCTFPKCIQPSFPTKWQASYKLYASARRSPFHLQPATAPLEHFDWLEAPVPVLAPTPGRPLLFHVLRPVAFLGLHLGNIYAFLM